MFNFFINSAQAVSLPDFQTTQDLGGFMSSIYSFSISIVGILIFIRFIWAGWIYLTAAGNSGKTKQATDMMTNAIIGALLLFSAYLILYVINPDLVSNTFNFDIIKNEQTADNTNKNLAWNKENGIGAFCDDSTPCKTGLVCREDNQCATSYFDSGGGDGINPETNPGTNPGSGETIEFDWENIDYTKILAVSNFDINPKITAISADTKLDMDIKYATSARGINSWCGNPGPDPKVKVEISRLDGVTVKGYFIDLTHVLYSKELSGAQFGNGKLFTESISQNLNEKAPVSPQYLQVFYNLDVYCMDVLKGWQRMSSSPAIMVDITP